MSLQDKGSEFKDNINYLNRKGYIKRLKTCTHAQIIEQIMSLRYIKMDINDRNGFILSNSGYMLSGSLADPM